MSDVSSLILGLLAIVCIWGLIYMVGMWVLPAVVRFLVRRGIAG